MSQTLAEYVQERLNVDINSLSVQQRIEMNSQFEASQSSGGK